MAGRAKGERGRSRGCVCVCDPRGRIPVPATAGCRRLNLEIRNSKMLKPWRMARKVDLCNWPSTGVSARGFRGEGMMPVRTAKIEFKIPDGWTPAFRPRNGEPAWPVGNGRRESRRMTNKAGMSFRMSKIHFAGVSTNPDLEGQTQKMLKNEVQSQYVVENK